MASLNVMAARKGNVTVNSCQIMDHAEVSQLRQRQMALEAIATVTLLSYEEGSSPMRGSLCPHYSRGLPVRGTGPTWGSVIHLSPADLRAVAGGQRLCLAVRYTHKQGGGDRSHGCDR